MSISSKIKITNSGTLAYNNPITRKEFKNILISYDEFFEKHNKLFENIFNKLEDDTKIKTLETILDIQQKKLIAIQEELDKLNKPKGFIAFIKKLF